MISVILLIKVGDDVETADVIRWLCDVIILLNRNDVTVRKAIELNDKKEEEIKE